MKNRYGNNKRVVLVINIKNEDSLVKLIKEFIAHLPSKSPQFGGNKKLAFGGVLLPSHPLPSLKLNQQILKYIPSHPLPSPPFAPNQTDPK
jgi:hypothetical protein